MPLLRNLRTLTSWNSLGHSRPVTGLIYSFLLDDESNPGQQCDREDTIENRTCDLPACSALPQPAAPNRNTHGILLCDNIIMEVNGSESGGFCVGGAEPLGSITKALIN